MAKYCTSCNQSYKDDSVFCPECGSELIEEQITPAPVAETPAPAVNYIGEELYPAVSTATYFWLNIAMAIPTVGFILSIILTCAPKNRSLKNYARAYLILNIILIGLGVLGIVLTAVVGGGLFALFEEAVPATSNPYMGF